MATDEASETSTFPAVDVEKELNSGQNKDFEVDSVSSDIAASTEIKERELPATEKKKGRDAMQTLKTTILVSAVIVAVAGAAFAITKKLRQK